MSCIERFMPLVVEKEDEGRSSPVITDRDVTFVYTKHMNLFCMCFLLFIMGVFLTVIVLVVAVCRGNFNVTLVFSFLYKIIDVFKEYFKDLEEESVRFVFIIVPFHCYNKFI